MLSLIYRRGSQVVRQGSAKASSSVRFRPTPFFILSTVFLFEPWLFFSPNYSIKLQYQKTQKLSIGFY